MGKTKEYWMQYAQALEEAQERRDSNRYMKSKLDKIKHNDKKGKIKRAL